MCCQWRVASAGAAARDLCERNILCIPDTRMASPSCAIVRVVSSVRAWRKSAHTFHRHVVLACRSWVGEFVRWRRHSVMRLFHSMRVALQDQLSDLAISRPTHQTYLMYFPCSLTPGCWNPETRLRYRPCLPLRVACSIAPKKSFALECYAARSSG